MTDGDRSRRPAERQLVSELRSERHRLLDGFESRDAVLRWGQRIAVRTLGEIPSRRYTQLAPSFKPDSGYLEGPLLAALLTEGARTRPISDSVAERVRESWAADVLGPVGDRSFRALRKDAGEYVGEGANEDGDPGYDPEEQAFAMRPTLSELDTLQAQTLDAFLGSGLADKKAILDWGDNLLSAARGEPVVPGYRPGEFIQKLYHEPSGVDLLTKDTPRYRRARQLHAAEWMLPAFTRGVRELTNRTAEEPAEGQTEDRGPTNG